MEREQSNSLILTSFAPYGRNTIRTIVPRDIAGALIDLLGATEWDATDLLGTRPVGINRCFSIQEGECTDSVYLHWNPELLEDCILSYARLFSRFEQVFLARHNSTAVSTLTTLHKPALMLLLRVPSQRGYVVQASFSNPVWDLLELEMDGNLQHIMHSVNTDLRDYWETLRNRKMDGQYGEVRNGKDGRTVQIMHPEGSELSLDGARKPDTCPFQFTVHNTDSVGQAMAQIVALCSMLKHASAVLKTP